MRHARKPRPRRLPDWLQDGLGQVLAILTTALALAFVGFLNPAHDTGRCPGGEGRPPLAPTVRELGRTMAEPGAGAPRAAEGTGGLTWGVVVGRDGIEPPTLRFSAARSTD